MSDEKNKEILDIIKTLYPQSGAISLHEPRFGEIEKQLLIDCLDSTFVSSVGKYVNQFEAQISQFTKSKFAIATSNGTSALHVGLVALGVKPGDEILTQALTFVATANAINYCGATPVFLDSDEESLGLGHNQLQDFLEKYAEVRNDGFSYNKLTNARIFGCIPMHVFGHPCKIKEIAKICKKHNIYLIEDAAEGLGSFVDDVHVGNFGEIATLSFNGNKIITCGGGGMVLTNNEVLAKKIKHLSTTAKIQHPWEFFHDVVGYNYRLPNLNAALGCAQMSKLDFFIKNKRETALKYIEMFSKIGIDTLQEPKGCTSNYWLNAIKFKTKNEKEEFLIYSNSQNVMTRPVWKLMPDLPMYKNCQTDSLEIARRLYDVIVNIPSSVRI